MMLTMNAFVSFFIIFGVLWMIKCEEEQDRLIQRTFGIAHDENCVVDLDDLAEIIVDAEKQYPKTTFRRLMEKDQTMDKLTEKQRFSHYRDLILGKASLAQTDRLKQNERFNSKQTNSKNRKLESETPSQRDYVIATLSILGDLEQKKTSMKRNLSEISDEPMKTFNLDELNADFIKESDDAGNYFKAAHKLPCLRFNPERDQKKKLTRFKTVIANDVGTRWCKDGKKSKTDPWHLYGPNSSFCQEPYGTGVTEAWSVVQQYGRKDRIVIGVVDSGCVVHPDIINNYCLKNEDCAGYNYGDDHADPFTGGDEFHGFYISSIIGARGNNGFGTAGVCWNCKIMCLNAYNSQAKTLLVSTTVQSTNHIIKASKNSILKISNHSYIGFTHSNMEKLSLQRLAALDHLVVFAAGNDDCNVDLSDPTSSILACIKETYRYTFFAPAGYMIPEILMVGAHDREGNKSSYSNFGKKLVHLFAPGDRIRTLDENCLADGEETITYISGTSAAAPIVAGIAALLLHADPTMTARELRTILMESTIKSSRLKDLCESGGRISANRAFRRFQTDYYPILMYRTITPTVWHRLQVCTAQW